jgi:hypothetical protein
MLDFDAKFWLRFFFQRCLFLFYNEVQLHNVDD